MAVKFEKKTGKKATLESFNKENCIFGLRPSSKLVYQQDVLVGTSVSSTPARGSVSKTSDIKVSELQKEIDGLKMISGAQQLRIQELEKNQRDMQERLRAQERYSRKDSVIILNPPYDARNVRDVTMETLKFFGYNN